MNLLQVLLLGSAAIFADALPSGLDSTFPNGLDHSKTSLTLREPVDADLERRWAGGTCSFTATISQKCYGHKHDTVINIPTIQDGVRQTIPNLQGGINSWILMHDPAEATPGHDIVGNYHGEITNFGAGQKLSFHWLEWVSGSKMFFDFPGCGWDEDDKNGQGKCGYCTKGAWSHNEGCPIQDDFRRVHDTTCFFPC
ncbi:hypothetical protein BDV96DRAFT_694851 [Lophiotrema nucula]|uniref:Uncharacterized protein n=1 Tax=Lophiotrema nucula TaxID=690887 RepID=A0A6A5YDQ2_9PLEO|nr:hypothetical protein BDV96DRAFT_694851 [Lophiotrema nucula]